MSWSAGKAAPVKEELVEIIDPEEAERCYLDEVFVAWFPDERSEDAGAAFSNMAVRVDHRVSGRGRRRHCPLDFIGFAAAGHRGSRVAVIALGRAPT